MNEAPVRASGNGPSTPESLGDKAHTTIPVRPPMRSGRHRKGTRGGEPTDVAIVTATTELQGNPDDTLLLGSLRSRGITAERPAWDDPRVRWDRYRLLVIRSTWNYQTQRARYLRWAERASRAAPLWNPLPVLKWNTSKEYLRELESDGLPIVPTRWLPKGSRADLGKLLTEPGWDRLVVKPVVSAGARETFLVTSRSRRQGQGRLDRLLRQESMMVQPYQSSVEDVGERSLIFLGGRFSHAVRKPPVLLRRSARYAARPVTATAAQRTLATRTLRSCLRPTLYARVDLVRDDVGRWRIGEVELTEPYLFLGSKRGAADRLSRAIIERLP